MVRVDNQESHADSENPACAVNLYRRPEIRVAGEVCRLVQGTKKNDPTIADGHPVYHSTAAAYQSDE